MNTQVLIIDDAADIRLLFRTILTPYYTTQDAACGAEGLDILRQDVPALILLDLAMPGLDGYETCRRLKRLPELRSTRVVVVSGHSDTEDLQKAFDAGADDFLVKPVNPHELLSRVRLHMRLHGTLRTASDLRPPDLVGDAASSLDRSQEILAGALLKLAETRDNETGQHLFRMRDYTMLLALHLHRDSVYSDQIDDSFLADLYRACPLHDIGKVGIPDDLLLKPCALSAEEFETMKQHTAIGAGIIEQAVNQMNGRGFLVMAMDIARFHHERWNGEGYLAGLAGSEIPLSARIVAVADVYDALTTERCYKSAWKPDCARQIIENGEGTHFDPIVVAAFRCCFPAFVETQNDYARKCEALSHPLWSADCELASAI